MVSLSPPPPGPRRLITNPALFQPDYIIRVRILQVTSFSFSFLTINDKFIILIEFQFAKIYETPIILTNPGIFRAYEKFDTKTVTRGYTSSIDTDLIIFASQPPLAADCRIKRAAMTVSITSHCTPVPRFLGSRRWSRFLRVNPRESTSEGGVGGGPGKEERSRQIDWSTDAVFAGWIPIMPYYLPSTPSAAIVSYRPGWATLWPPSDTRY